MVNDELLLIIQRNWGKCLVDWNYLSKFAALLIKKGQL